MRRPLKKILIPVVIKNYYINQIPIFQAISVLKKIYLISKIFSLKILK